MDRQFSLFEFFGFKNPAAAATAVPAMIIGWVTDKLLQQGNVPKETHKLVSELIARMGEHLEREEPQMSDVRRGLGAIELARGYRGKLAYDGVVSLGTHTTLLDVPEGYKLGLVHGRDVPDVKMPRSSYMLVKDLHMDNTVRVHARLAPAGGLSCEQLLDDARVTMVCKAQSMVEEKRATASSTAKASTTEDLDLDLDLDLVLRNVDVKNLELSEEPYLGLFTFLLGAFVTEAASGRILLDAASGRYTLNPEVHVELDPAAKAIEAAKAAIAARAKFGEDLRQRRAQRAEIAAAGIQREEARRAKAAAKEAAALAATAAEARAPALRPLSSKENKPVSTRGPLPKFASDGTPCASSSAASLQTPPLGSDTGAFAPGKIGYYFKEAARATSSSGAGTVKAASRLGGGGGGRGGGKSHAAPQRISSSAIAASIAAVSTHGAEAGANALRGGPPPSLAATAGGAAVVVLSDEEDDDGDSDDDFEALHVHVVARQGGRGKRRSAAGPSDGGGGGGGGGKRRSAAGPSGGMNSSASVPKANADANTSLGLPPPSSSAAACGSAAGGSAAGAATGRGRLVFSDVDNLDDKGAGTAPARP